MTNEEIKLLIQLVEPAMERSQEALATRLTERVEAGIDALIEQLSRELWVDRKWIAEEIVAAATSREK